MKVCVYAVCKNESLLVKTWVDSLIDADYIYLLDCGSDDTTYVYAKQVLSGIGLAEQYEDPTKLLTDGFLDYGKAKTEAFKRAKTYCSGNEWIFVNLNLEDIIEVGGLEKLKNTWTSDMFGTLNFEDVYKFRAHSGDSNIEWSGITHEYLCYDGKPCYSYQSTHYAVRYSLNPIFTRDDDSEQIRSLIKQNPKSIWYNFWGGFLPETPDTWYENLIKLIETNKSDPFYNNPELLSFLKLKICFDNYSINEKLEALNQIEKFIKKGKLNPFRTFYYEYSKALYNIDFSKSKEMAIKGLELTEPFKNLFTLDSDDIFEESITEELMKIVEQDHAYKICVYAICKDELKYVDLWLNSMSEADYIVVLDTGSTDGTYEALKKDSRVTIVKQQSITPWRFDTARNASMELIPEDTDICVCTDLDERFEPGWANILRSVWSPKATRVNYTYTWNHKDDGSNGATFWYEKIHSHGTHHWEYPIHETCFHNDDIKHDLSTEFDKTIRESRIHLHHYQDKNRPRASYLDMIKLRAQEYPTDPFSMYYLAREYRQHLYGADAVAQYKKAIQLFEDQPEIVDIYGMFHASCAELTDLLLKDGNLGEAEVFAAKCVKRCPTIYKGYVLLADIYNATHRPNMAIGTILDGRRASVRSGSGTEALVDPGTDDLILALSYKQLDDLSSYQKYLELAFSKNPTHPTIAKLYNELNH